MGCGQSKRVAAQDPGRKIGAKVGTQVAAEAPAVVPVPAPAATSDSEAGMKATSPQQVSVTVSEARGLPEVVGRKQKLVCVASFSSSPDVKHTSEIAEGPEVFRWDYHASMEGWTTSDSISFSIQDTGNANSIVGTATVSPEAIKTGFVGQLPVVAGGGEVIAGATLAVMVEGVEVSVAQQAVQVVSEMHFAVTTAISDLSVAVHSIVSRLRSDADDMVVDTIEMANDAQRAVGMEVAEARLAVEDRGVKVVMNSARGLTSGGGDLPPVCKVQVVGKPAVVLQTVEGFTPGGSWAGQLGSSEAPVWGTAGHLENYEAGDSLVFEVVARSGGVIGRHVMEAAVVKSGFIGEVLLQDAEGVATGGHLSINVDGADATLTEQAKHIAAEGLAAASTAAGGVQSSVGPVVGRLGEGLKDATMDAKEVIDEIRIEVEGKATQCCGM